METLFDQEYCIPARFSLNVFLLNFLKNWLVWQMQIVPCPTDTWTFLELLVFVLTYEMLDSNVCDINTRDWNVMKKLVKINYLAKCIFLQLTSFLRNKGARTPADMLATFPNKIPKLLREFQRPKLIYGKNERCRKQSLVWVLLPGSAYRN